VVEVVFGGELGETQVAVDDDAPPFAVKFNAQHHAHLRDHSLRGTPVLPAVFALDLMVQAAERRCPGRMVSSVSALKVLRGVPLSRFGNGGNELTVRLREQPTGQRNGVVVLDAEVFLDGQGAPRYRAKVEMADAPHAPPLAPAAPSALRPFPQDRAGIYRDLLFHGPSFQLIDAVHGVGETGIVATVRGVRQSDWVNAVCHVDAGALDAGLQLVLLLARHAKKGAFLPTAVERFVRYRPTLSTGPLRCVVHSRPVSSPDRLVADLWFVEEDQGVSMMMEGVEVHRLLDSEAFRRSPEDDAVLAAS
jgi:hypothetical protein